MEGGGLNANMNKQIGNNGAIYVYYKIAEPTKPKVICISVDGNTSNNKWYKAGGSATDWSEDKTNFTNKDPSATEGATAVTESDLTTAVGSEETFTPSGTANYIIKLDKRHLTTGPSNKIKYRTGDKEFTVERKEGSPEGTDGVPDNYVRYDHKPTTAGYNFTLSSVKHNDQVLSGITGSNVQAVYVYYHKDGDTDHQFPLIVCVKTTTFTYYQRGNKWKTIPGLTADPETLKDADLNSLRTNLEGVKGDFEVKLEWNDTSTPYKANPNNDNITVESVSGSGGFKGFKHHKQDSSVIDINRITIHGQALKDIQETDLSNKKYVFVYFRGGTQDSNNERPLLICLAVSDRTADSGNIWYERKNNKGIFTWERGGNAYQSISPGGESGNQIEQNLNDQLDDINRQVSDDPGYPPLDLILKLDYRPASAQGIKYVTGDNNDPSKRVITVERTNGTTTGPVPQNYVRYKHSLSSGQTNTFNLSSVKHNGFPLNGITQENNVQAVYVYYHSNDTNEHQFPLIVCVKTSETARKYYTRGQTWSEETSLSGVDPESPGTEGLPKLQGKLEELKVKYEIDIGNTNTGQGYKANAEGQEITVTQETREANGVPTDYIRYEHKLYNISFKLVFVMYNDIIGVYPVSDLWELEGELIREGLHGEWKR